MFKPLIKSKITKLVELRMMSLALSGASGYTDPPVPLPMALYTMFRKNVNRITADIVHNVAAIWLSTSRPRA